MRHAMSEPPLIARAPVNSKKLSASTQKGIQELTTLKNPELLNLVDQERLLMSDLYLRILEAAAQQAIRYTQYAYVYDAIELIKDHEDKQQVIKWFCLRAALHLKPNEQQPSFIKTGKAPEPRADLKALLSFRKKRIKIEIKPKRVRKLVQNPKVLTEKLKPPPDFNADMLDHPARLPGSYGTGHRR